MKKTIYISFILFFIVKNVCSQDIHFTQFWNVPLYHNPALTGVYSGDMRMVANYRNQWASVPVPYSTFHGSFEQKIPIKRLGNNVLGGGILLNHDQAGDSKLSRTNITLSSAYTHQLSNKHFLSGGLQIGIAQRRFQTDELTFDNQFNGDVFDGNLPTNEVFTNKNFIFGELNAGLNWHFQLSQKGISADAGIGLAHINKPPQSFFENEVVRLPRRMSIFAKANIPVTPIIDLQPALLIQRQGAYRENIYGTNFKYHFSKKAGNEMGVYIGAWHRTGDALAFSAGVDYLNLSVGISYDINISPFKTATNGAGGPEISAIYTITKVQSLEEFKSCPIF